MALSEALAKVRAATRGAFKPRPVAVRSRGAAVAASRLARLDARQVDHPLGLKHGVSVVVASHGGENTIARCLDSLGAQTLSPDRFEIIVVLNGALDGSVDIVESFRDRKPHLNVRVLTQDKAGLSLARNSGIAAARFSNICWCDDDDELSPNYLRAMLEAAKPGVIPVAQLVNRHPDGTLATENPLGDALRASAGLQNLAPEKFHHPFSFDACKLLPTALVRDSMYDPKLRSGQDIAFNISLLTRAPFQFHVLPLQKGATYFRYLVPGSLSRRELDFTFAVEERLDVIQRLGDTLQDLMPGDAALARTFIRSQTLFIARFLEQSPESIDRVKDEIVRRPLAYFDFGQIGLPADTLVVSYCFPPAADVSGIVMAKRIRSEGIVCDVVSNEMSKVRGTDAGLDRIYRPLVRRHDVLNAPQKAFSWSSIAKFTEAGLSTTSGRHYGRIYSRSMWPHSHFLAAMLRINGVGDHWTAEFSDPLSVDVQGNVRFGELLDDPILDTIADRIREEGFEPPSDGNLLTWCEAICYALADRIVFTNTRQFELMIERAPAEFHKRIRGVAEIRPHPTLSRDFYALTNPVMQLSPAHLNIAYFGTFYATRGLGEVVDAIEAIATKVPVRLHVFASNGEALVQTIADRPARDHVEVHPFVPFLDFLSLSDRFDGLLVNDAVSVGCHPQNPYLPSKWSDYAGSLAPVWGLIEDGSALSEAPLDVASRLGDRTGAVGAIARLAELAAVRRGFEPQVDVPSTGIGSDRF